MARADENHGKQRKPGSRDERRAAALRENLRRRKAQERGRATPQASIKSADLRTEDDRT